MEQLINGTREPWRVRADHHRGRVLAIFILPQAIRILREYERGVIFRLGKLQGAKGPGLFF